MLGHIRRLRPLPLAIAAMALLAVFKLGSLTHGAGPAPLATAARAILPAAQASSPAAPAPAAPPPAPAKPATAAVDTPADPAPTDAERALWQDLRARRTALDTRTQALEAREAILAAAERRLSERVDQLTALQTRLETLDQTKRERDEANWRGLVKTYETMRPRDAAAIFNELDQPVLLQVLDRMKEAKAAPILAAMLPDRARAATAKLAQWRTRVPAGPQG